jgi:glycosyltransferase involved in cell wall biosynthesis
VHIVQLTDFYHPVIGGLERAVAALSGECTRLGHRVTVVTLAVPGRPAEDTVNGIRVVSLGGWSQRLTRLYADSSKPFHPTAPDPGTVAALRRVLRSERPDVVHSHGWVQYSFAPLYRARQGPAHVVTLHDYGLSCARKTLVRAGQPGQCAGPRLASCLRCAPEQYGAVKAAAIAGTLRASRVLHRRADRYIAVSSAVAEGCRVAVPAPDEISIVPTMVPNGLAGLATATPRPGFLPAADGYLMFAGALGRHKGVDVLLAAHRRMRHRVPLVLLGTPRADAPPVAGPDVIVAKNVPNAQVMAAWARASVAVVPSIWHEPMGQVAIEAMLVGCPVVASDVGGLRDIVEHGVTGLRVPPGDPDALAAALDGLLADPAARQRMGAAGRVRARRFEVSEVAPQVLAVFEDALRARACQ